MSAVVDKSTATIRRDLLGDPALTEDARVFAWIEAGAQSLSVRNDQLVGVPHGWPLIVHDPDKFVRDYLDRLLYQPPQEQ